MILTPVGVYADDGLVAVVLLPDDARMSEAGELVRSAGMTAPSARIKCLLVRRRGDYLEGSAPLR